MKEISTGQAAEFYPSSLQSNWSRESSSRRTRHEEARIVEESELAELSQETSSLPLESSDFQVGFWYIFSFEQSYGRIQYLNFDLYTSTLITTIIFRSPEVGSVF